MNRSINVLLVFLLIPIMLVTIFVGFDLPLTFLKTTGAQMPYREQVFLGLGLIVFIVNVRRSIRRWVGMSMVSKVKKFKWNQPVSLSRKKRVATYSILEIAVMTFVAIALYSVSPQAWFPAIAFLFGAVDNLIFTVVGLKTNNFRIGLSSKALVIADREIIVLYFTGLRKVSQHQQSVYFDYIKGLQMDFPTDCIQEENRGEFFKTLEAQLDPERVYFSQTMV